MNWKVLPLLFPQLVRLAVVLFLAYVGRRADEIGMTMHGFDSVVMGLSSIAMFILAWFFWQSPEWFTWAYWDEQDRASSRPD